MLAQVLLNPCQRLLSVVYEIRALGGESENDLLYLLDFAFDREAGAGCPRMSPVRIPGSRSTHFNNLRVFSRVHDGCAYRKIYENSLCLS